MSLSDREVCESSAMSRAGWLLNIGSVMTLFLTLIQVPFTIYFVKKLVMSVKNWYKQSLTIFVLIYNALAVNGLISMQWHYWWEPIYQRKHRFTIHDCSSRVAWSTVNSSNIYIVLIEILILRLHATFQGSPMNLSSVSIYFLQMICLIYWICSMIFNMILIDQFNCYTRNHSGWQYDLGLAKKSYYLCGTQKITLAVFMVVYGTRLMIVVVGTVLGYMFISRLNSLARSAKRKAAIFKLAQKSTVIALASIISTVFTIVVAMLTQSGFIFPLDVFINQVCLACLFSFGHDLYLFLFGTLEEWWVTLTQRNFLFMKHHHHHHHHLMNSKNSSTSKDSMNEEEILFSDSRPRNEYHQSNTYRKMIKAQSGDGRITDVDGHPTTRAGHTTTSGGGGTATSGRRERNGTSYLDEDGSDYSEDDYLDETRYAAMTTTRNNSSRYIQMTDLDDMIEPPVFKINR